MKTAARTKNRRAMLAKVHIAKKHLGLDDETYRAALKQVTGKTSAADCTDAELDAVISHFKKSGFRPQASGGSKRKASDGERRYLPKLRALWLSGWNLGVVQDPSDEAMVAFVKRQTGLDHVRFMQRSEDAVKAIEGLKSWLTRAAFVDWSFDDDPRACVVKAQWEVICQLCPAVTQAGDDIPPAERTFHGLTFQWALANAQDALIKDLGVAIRAVWNAPAANTLQ